MKQIVKIAATALIICNASNASVAVALPQPVQASVQATTHQQTQALTQQQIDEFFWAIRATNFAQVRQLAQANPTLAQAQNNWGDTPLTENYNNPEMAKLLLELGAKPNQQNKEGLTPLMQAAYHNNVTTAKLLLEHGADVTIKDQQGRSALNHLWFEDHLEIIKLFFAHGADLNNQAPDGATVLMRAAYAGNLASVEFLLANGAKVNLLTNEKYGALAHALWRNKNANNFAVIKLLVAHKADVNQLSSWFETPFYMAITQGSLEIVKLFADNADVNQQDAGGCTPIMTITFAAHKQPQLAPILVEIAKVLLEHGAEVNTPGSVSHDTLLHEVVRYFPNKEARLTLIQLLLAHGANPNIQGDEGYTPLMAAATFEHKPEIVELLVNNGTNIFIKDIHGKTVLDHVRGTEMETLIVDTFNNLPFWKRLKARLRF